MHRSGTSLLTRGLQSLGVFLGDDFLDSRPDNPTGYWEDRVIVGLNERLLREFGLTWESICLIDHAQWQGPAVQDLRREAVEHLRLHFLPHGLWGFKDPRIVRLLPFWRSVLQGLNIDDRYVIAVRNPLSVAASLWNRQSISTTTSHLMSLVYLVPHLDEIAARPFVVVDYDLLLANPREQLERIRRALNLPLGDPSEVEHFATGFLDLSLRHACVGPDEFDLIAHISPLIREAYLRLYQLATDRAEANSDFWAAWRRIRSALEALISSREAAARQVTSSQASEETVPRDSKSPAWEKRALPRLPETHKSPNRAAGGEYLLGERALFPGSGVRMFVVVGAQRTGTNLLREILNTHDQIAMLGEVLSPSSAPAHWENFLKFQVPGIFPAPGLQATTALLDRYFEYVLYRIRNCWVDGDKSRCRAIGVDIKYNQLRYLAPSGWDADAAPFLLQYLRSRGVTLIHVTRKNVIHCAISALVAQERKLWHNYEGVAVDRRFTVDPELCLDYARSVARDRRSFLDSVAGCKVVEVSYEDLAGEIADAGPGAELPEQPGPLRDIVRAIEVPFAFRWTGRLHKAINVPYSELLSNLEVLTAALKQSEFSALAPTLL